MSQGVQKVLVDVGTGFKDRSDRAGSSHDEGVDSSVLETSKIKKERIRRQRRTVVET